MIKTYYALTKPGIIYGNVVTTIAGFFLASKGHITYSIFFGICIGTSLVIGSACVFNNYTDREIDAKMERTKNRASVRGIISPTAQLTYGTILGLLGITTLLLYTNLLTLGIGLIAFFFYVVLYGLSKRHSVYGTIVGSVAGAAPIVAGYTAVTNHFDLGALLLFLILVFWQMPHFYAIAMYRKDDYIAAALPVLPVQEGNRTAKQHIVGYIITYIIAAIALTVYGYAGYAYLVVTVGLGLTWLALALRGFQAADDTLWAKGLFRFSLIIILALSVMLSLNGVLH